MAQLTGLADDVPSMGRRQFMNVLMFGSEALVAAGALYPVIKYFIPPSSGSSSGGVTAKDALGNDIVLTDYLTSHPSGDHSLVQGLKGDPTYLVVQEDKTINENKFMCPCHGSQYDSTGKVVRGPAPLSLALAHANVEDNKVALTPWTETDFRTDEKPWWA